MSERALAPWTPGAPASSAAPGPDPEYGQPRHLTIGGPHWLSDVVAALPHPSPLLTANGLSLRSTGWHPTAEGSTYKDANFLPPTSDDAFGRLTGAVALLRFEGAKAKMGQDVLETQEYKLVNLDVAPGAIALDVIRRHRREQLQHSRPEEFKDPGLPGTYILASPEPTTGEYRVCNVFSYNDVINEVPIIAYPTAEGLRLASSYPADLLKEERWIMQRDGVTPYQIVRALEQKYQIMTDPELRPHYEEILRGVLERGRNSQLSGDEYERYQILEVLPELPGVSDSYLWRAYLHHIGERLQYELTSRRPGLSEELQEEIVDYYCRSRAKLTLLENRVATDQNPYQLVMVMGSMDAVHDPAWGQRHDNAAKILHDAYDQYGINLDRDALQMGVTGSFYVDRPFHAHVTDPDMKAVLYPFGSQKVFEQHEFMPPIPPTIDTLNTPFSSLSELLDEQQTGYDADAYPKLPGVVGKFTVELGSNRWQQFVVIRVDDSLGIFGDFIHYSADHPNEVHTIENIVNTIVRPKRANTYALVERSATHPRGYEVAAVLGHGVVTAFEKSQDEELPDPTLHTGNYPSPMEMAMPAPGRRGRRQARVLRPQASQELVPYLPTLERTATDRASGGRKARLAAMVSVHPHTGEAIVMADPSQGADALIVSPVGRRRRSS